MDIITYLNSKDIFIESNFLKRTDKLENDIKNQIELIVEVQKKLMSSKITIIPRVNSTIGKEFEGFKVQIKKLDKQLGILSSSSEKDDLDFYILDIGTKVLERAKGALNKVDKDSYFNIIRRSMRNYEMCLGRVDEGNLKRDELGNVKIRTEKYISYNLVEQDIFNYIKRIKRREHSIPIEEIIDEFVYMTSLSSDSKMYIKSICSYPLESMKLLYKYTKDNDNQYNYDEWINKIILAVKIDGDELI